MHVSLQYPNCYDEKDRPLWEEILKERDEYWEGFYEYIDVSVTVFEMICKDFEERKNNKPLFPSQESRQ